jgi:DNA-binding beta-propeller fold protein YncE
MAARTPSTSLTWRHAIGGQGKGPLQFWEPRQVFKFIAPDGFVFVAESGNHRVQVLTPTLDFHAFTEVGRRGTPFGVCANADVVVVSEYLTHTIAVFSLCDGSLVRRLGSNRSCNDKPLHPRGLCFMSDDRHVAVADDDNDRVSVFSVAGEFIRYIGKGVLRRPKGVAASAFDELVVADTGSRCLRLFSAAGDLLASVGEGDFTGVVVHGSSVLAVDVVARIMAVFQ